MIRSLKQNNYYFKCIVLPIGDYLGYYKWEMHELLKASFLADTSKELTTKEFEDYCEKIRIWALQDLGIKLMRPNEYE
tara:strand:- start:6562 stop:6795 length:234 start_codon:yes stop_codon:yes gene_type:complete